MLVAGAGRVAAAACRRCALAGGRGARADRSGGGGRSRRGVALFGPATRARLAADAERAAEMAAGARSGPTTGRGGLVAAEVSRRRLRELSAPATTPPWRCAEPPASARRWPACGWTGSGGSSCPRARVPERGSDRVGESPSRATFCHPVEPASAYRRSRSSPPGTRPPRSAACASPSARFARQHRRRVSWSSCAARRASRLLRARPRRRTRRLGELPAQARHAAVRRASWTPRSRSAPRSDRAVWRRLPRRRGARARRAPVRRRLRHHAGPRRSCSGARPRADARPDRALLRPAQRRTSPTCASTASGSAPACTSSSARPSRRRRGRARAATCRRSRASSPARNLDDERRSPFCAG